MKNIVVVILLSICCLFAKESYAQAHPHFYEITCFDDDGGFLDPSEFIVTVVMNGVTLGPSWIKIDYPFPIPITTNPVIEFDVQGFGPTTARRPGTPYILTVEQRRGGVLIGSAVINGVVPMSNPGIFFGADGICLTVVNR